MRATSTAKKPAKPAGPTWSKVGSPKPKAQSSKPKARRSTAKARRPSSIVHRPKSKAPPLAIPTHVQREITALLLLVGAALFGLGLVTWRAGGQGAVGYMGGFLAQMFGVAAWLVPAALGVVAFVLLLGGRRDEWRLSPLVRVGCV